MVNLFYVINTYNITLVRIHPFSLTKRIKQIKEKKLSLSIPSISIYPNVSPSVEHSEEEKEIDIYDLT